MSVRRALVDCAVLSLQDSCVYYPSCKCCFSRIHAEQQDATRCRCSKCGYSYLREQVDYRYRLSLKVARDTCIFGVTVFGTCLNPFFGIPASGLKRLVDSLDGPVGASTRSTLLVKAVEDCFIGRHFIFGIKLTVAEGGLWLGQPVANGSSGKDKVQFIASQMILPKATELTGCTVVSYYRILLQKAEEYELGSTDTSRTSRPPPSTLMLIHHHSPASSFNNTTLSASGLLSHSLQRSQYQDSTLSPTPPWQQSLGLITSSAEQEEGCSTRDSGNENSRWSDNKKMEHHTLRACQENHKIKEDPTLSPLLSYNSRSFARYSSIEKTVVNTWFSPSQSAHTKNLPPTSKMKEFSSTQLTKTFLSSSLAWDDLPFSESLTEFLCEKDKDFDNGAETEPHLHMQNQTETVKSFPEMRSKERNLSTESNSFCLRNARITMNQSQLLLDITNTPASTNGGDRHYSCEKVCEDPVGCVKENKTRSICSHDCNQNIEEAGSLFQNENQLEGDTYNCSADLFSDSLLISMNTSLNTQTETVGTAGDACTRVSSKMPIFFPHSTPDKQKLENKKCINKDNLISPSRQGLDFVPWSQSTPNVELTAVSGSPASSYSSLRFSLTLGEFGSQRDSHSLCALYGNLPKSDSKNPGKMTSSLCKVNTVNAHHLSKCARESAKENLVWSTTSSRRSYRFTPKRRFWKSDKCRQYPLLQRGALNPGSTDGVIRKCDSSVCDVTACEYEDNEVPPTPAAKTLQRQWTANSSSSSDPTCEGHQAAGIMCKRALLHPALTSSQSRVGQTGNCDSELVGDGDLVGSSGDLLDEIQACDWSRDLFSDSI